MTMNQNERTGPSTAPEVVIIDDDRASARAIGAYVRRHGFGVITADNAFAGLHAVRRARPAVVLMDIQMPGIDGIEAAALIRRFSPGSHVVLMSGYASQLSKAGRDATDAFAILEKPLPLPAILDFIRRAVS
jgi:DNA-binding NtrC family response regulator